MKALTFILELAGSLFFPASGILKKEKDKRKEKDYGKQRNY